MKKHSIAYMARNENQNKGIMYQSARGNQKTRTKIKTNEE